MIFAHTLDKILCGEKRQTRRLVKPGEQLITSVDKVAVVAKRTVYEVGKTYAVQPNRGKKAVARILLTGLQREKVRDISSADAIAEGFLSRDEFLKTWRSIHGAKADLEHEVWVLEFELHTLTSGNLEESYEYILSANRSPNNGHDLSPSVTGLSGINLYSRNYQGRQLGSPLSY